MPTYDLTSSKTGATYKLNFDNEPSQSDVDDAISHLDDQTLKNKGGAGEPMDRSIAEAIDRRRQSLTDKKFPGEGKFPNDFSQSKTASFASGGLRGLGRMPGQIIEAGLNASPAAFAEQAIGNLLGKEDLGGKISKVISSPAQDLTSKALSTSDVPIDNPESPEFKNPQSAALGDTIAQAVSLNPRLATSPIQSLKTGASFLTKAIAPKVAARSAPATVEAVGNSVLDIPEEEVSKLLPVVKKRVYEVSDTTPETSGELLSSIKKAKQNLYNERTAVTKVADEQGLAPSGDKAVQEAKNVLDNMKTISKNKKTEVLNEISDIYGGKKTSVEGQDIQEQLNNKFSEAFKNDTLDRSDAKFQAEKAIRDSFADQMDEIHQSITGLDDTPYSDIGKLIETETALQKKVDSLKGVVNKAKTGIESAPGKLPVYKHGFTHKAINAIAGPLQKNQVEKLDAAIPRLFEGEADVAAQKLSPEEISSLRSKYTAGPEEPVIPSNVVPMETAVQAENTDLGKKIAKALKININEANPQQIQTIRDIAQKGQVVSQGKVKAVNQSMPEQIQEVVQSEERVPRSQMTELISVAPEAVPVKTYPEDVQAALDQAKSKYDSRVDFIKRSSMDNDQKSKRLKGVGMEFAAEKRQITGELTGKEAARKSSREAGNYVGKPIQVNMGGENVSAKVIGNPFGRVKVRLADGREITVSPENISSE